MTAQEQINAFISLGKKNIQANLSQTKKNIVFISYYPTYRSQYGNLVQKLKQKYNVITVVDRILNDTFEKSSHFNILFPWRVVENGETYYLNADIEGIDLIITADEVGYLDGKIDREFLSKSAKRIYMPHRLTYDCGSTNQVDYINVPSASALASFKQATKNTNITLLPCGYPQLDNLIANYQYHNSNTITYAPTLRYVDNVRNTDLNAFAGFDGNIIEWLLKNTNYNISYRAHPFNTASNHNFYSLIKARFKEEKRLSFDEKQGYDYFNFSDFLITDWSTTSFLYSYATLRPCFFYMPYPPKNTKENEYILKDKLAKNFFTLKSLLSNIDFAKEAQRFKKLREENIYNIGTSEEALIEKIDQILQGKL
ncbi:hypothetical protein B6S12_07945 [Helicobacter valdiviensis]|uniref:CDP-glycerol--glycerophosphate glycerophosphotransferase n=1 Tax=Helicobacter valdiviensis TaxID=1458358 RepID=A0A2W6MSX1_9HELI|nr:CDP-glycerol glycerophosphotransferase family protein [Helicobacter valdiviensis]PZT47655.1 hypothetical protein B6S12_07945 [Helicobacter valdiviensis]